MGNNNQTEQERRDLQELNITEDLAQESILATDQRAYLETAVPLPLNEMLRQTQDEIKQMSVDELEASGVQFVSKTLNSNDERHLYRVEHSPDDVNRYMYKCYFRQPSNNANEELFVNTFEVDQNGMLIDGTWSGSEVIGSSVAHGVNGFSTLSFPVLEANRYFVIGLFENHTLPNAPYIFFVAKVSEID